MGRALGPLSGRSAGNQRTATRKVTTCMAYSEAQITSSSVDRYAVFRLCLKGHIRYHNDNDKFIKNDATHVRKLTLQHKNVHHGLQLHVCIVGAVTFARLTLSSISSATGFCLILKGLSSVQREVIISEHTAVSNTMKLFLPLGIPITAV